jgi:hypothetical protein
MMDRTFSLFIAKMRNSFRSIAKATRYEVTEHDLHSDAWIIAHEITVRRGREVDFSDLDDQLLIIKAVNLQNVRRGDWHMRKSVRIDQDEEHEDGVQKWSERLPAPEASDPLHALLRKESALDTEAKLAGSYSQAAAYVRAFARFKYDSKLLSAYLRISKGALSRRVGNVAASVMVQPSLFDGLYKIGKRFKPVQGSQRTVQAKSHLAGQQGEWKF